MHDVDLPEFSCYCKQYVHGFQASTRLEAVQIGNDGHIILVKNWIVGVQLQKALYRKSLIVYVNC